LTKILRARLILPIASPPIEDGAVRVSGNRIVEFGRWKDFEPADGEEVFDSGESILLPGLINAHCHLDYTDMAGKLPPQKSFTDWIKLMLTAKAEWNYSEFAESWLNGAKMLLRTGTTTVADFEAVPELLPDVWSATPLRIVSLLEMTGVKSRRAPRDILRDNLEHMATLPGGRCRSGLAPHAPYSTAPELLRLTAETARRRQWLLSVHISESVEEFAMYADSNGAMFEWLRRNGRDMTDCGSGSPVKKLASYGVLGENCLAIHVNYLAKGDATLLARTKTNVVHCPRSHFYFRHKKFPCDTLTRAKVNVCLGSDSLATVYKTPRQEVKLSMFNEMQAFASAHSKVSPEKILQMATINGARALGMAGEAGEISKNSLADLIAIPFAGNTRDAFAAAVNYQGNVSATLIDGEWAIRP
jgi:cytosine/adenosine deaminase-related metal-dependent hydrolase